MEHLWRTSRRDIVKGVDFTVLQIRCDDLIESDHVGERSTLHFRNIHDEIPILRSTLMIKCQSVITNRDRNCLACRLTSGCGLIGAGLYVAYQSKKFNRKPGLNNRIVFPTDLIMEFPSLGEHCSEKTCNRLDFLPLKCDACESIFCTDHISYLGHSCPSIHKKDVQVPVCPLCNVPIPLKRGDPPDLAVGMHIDNDCQSDYGKSNKKVFVNRCSSKGCKIKEIVRVDCHDCGNNYCLKHRHPVDHNCVGREEAVRLKRLEAIKNKQEQKRGPSLQVNDMKNSGAFRNVQGTMTEDEALAKALQASLQEQEKIRRQQLQPVPSSSRDRCSLS
ncbi:hypothetical protein PV326_008988 [Microctonus aethiopoides]|nr:hypothetical protein PV326_008988 [Microctonus aethiopoides]